jgi:branched-chain amino acid transport system substrate-binding protein
MNRYRNLKKKTAVLCHIKPFVMMTVVLLAVGLTLPVKAKTAEYEKKKTEKKEKKVEQNQSYGRTPDRYVPFKKFTEPYKRFFMDPLEYTGYGRNIPEPETLECVKIGFLGPIQPTVSVATGGKSHEEALGKKMLQGATLAIEETNARGGFIWKRRGKKTAKIPYKLVVRNDNGLWGASGNEIIHLAYRDNVWAILGTIDGANSHIAIRVALKIEIPMVNSGDTDPTFTETAIPWVFRSITDDRQMCYLLADYVFKKLKYTRVAALRANNRYGRIGIGEFRDAATRLGNPFLTELNYPLGATDFNAQLQRIKSLNPEVIVTYGDAAESALILKQMRAMGMNQLFVGSDRMVTQKFIDNIGKNPGKIVAGYPYLPSEKRKRFKEFKERFVKRFGEEPETYASHAYDGMKMLIRAIGKAGLNRALIRDELAKIKTFRGVTGQKEFDPVYNNISPASLAVLENGRWVFYTEEEALK